MMIELTQDQSKAIEQAGSRTPCVTDPRTRTTYFLVPADLFERIQGLLNGTDEALADTYLGQTESALRAGWNDPDMEEYSDYDANRNRARQ